VILSGVTVWPADSLSLTTLFRWTQIDPGWFICVSFPEMSPGQTLPASLQRPLGTVCEVYGAGGTAWPWPSVHRALWRGLQHPPRNCSHILLLKQWTELTQVKSSGGGRLLSVAWTTARFGSCSATEPCAIAGAGGQTHPCGWCSLRTGSRHWPDAEKFTGNTRWPEINRQICSGADY